MRSPRASKPRRAYGAQVEGCALVVAPRGAKLAPETVLFQGTGREVPSDQPPSLFTALDGQLGLRLIPQRIPIEVFTIDAIERPTSN